MVNLEAKIIFIHLGHTIGLNYKFITRHLSSGFFN